MKKDLHIKISENLLNEAKRISNKYEMSLSSMVRFIIKDFIEKDSE